MLKRLKVRVESVGSSNGAPGFGLTLFGLSTLKQTNGANANVEPVSNRSYFAFVACFSTGDASNVGIARGSGALCACFDMRGVTARR